MQLTPQIRPGAASGKVKRVAFNPVHLTDLSCLLRTLLHQSETMSMKGATLPRRLRIDQAGRQASLVTFSQSRRPSVSASVAYLRSGSVGFSFMGPVYSHAARRGESQNRVEMIFFSGKTGAYLQNYTHCI